MFNSVNIFQPSVDLKNKIYVSTTRIWSQRRTCAGKKEGPKMLKIDVLTLNLMRWYLLGLTALEVTVKSRFPPNVSQCKSVWTLLTSEVYIRLYRKENNWVTGWKVEWSGQRSADRSENQYKSMINKVPKLAVK